MTVRPLNELHEKYIVLHTCSLIMGNSNCLLTAVLVVVVKVVLMGQRALESVLPLPTT